MKKETRLLLRRIFIGSLALMLFMVVVLSSIYSAFPGSLELWVIFVLIGVVIAVFIAVMVLIERYARRKK